MHIILEEFENVPMQTGKSKPLSLITWSAKTEASVGNYAEKLADFAQNNKDTNVADIATTLQNTRADFNHRRFIIAGDIEELSAKLAVPVEPSNTKNLASKASEVVFMFPGQGSQYINMGKGLYDTEPVFLFSLDECIELLKDSPQADIFNIIYPAVIDDVSTAAIKNTFYTQPAIFIMEYAMAKLWMSWGIRPAILTGHSIG